MTHDQINKLNQDEIDLESKRADLILKLAQTKPKTPLLATAKEWIGFISLILGLVTSVYAIFKLNFEYDSYALKREKERRLTLSADLIKNVNDLNSSNDSVALRALTLIQYNSIDAIPILLAALERDTRTGIPPRVNSTVNAILDYNSREEKSIVELICARFQSVWRISAADGDNLPLIEKYNDLIKSLSVSPEAKSAIENTINVVKKDLTLNDPQLRDYLITKLDNLLAYIKSRPTK